ncbi:MAG TPA: M43 family zinc metalloprotease [Bacteroidia bacterium]|nr:M43 family zinc metalloprotease [Bacteroidia bacterium]
MKKNNLFFPFVFVFVFLINIHESFSQDDNHKFCGTNEMYEKALKKYPDYAKNQALLEQETAEYSKQMALQGNEKIQGTVYIIPVVFHVLHEWGSENISDAQIIDQVNIFNTDFRKLNADTNLIIPSFTGVAADCEIEFRLAQLDPNGNCTNGIDRIVSSKTNAADDGSKLNNWPHQKYLNIWTVRTIGAAGVAGYAYYPGAANGIDGIVILSDYVGSIGTGSVSRSRAMTHEVGHYLNLQHVWGNSNNVGVACGDDNVFDTPITKGFSFCPQPANAAICNPPIIENYQNYMDYSYCTRMFTTGQKNRMRTALLSSVGLRNNLWTTANLLATGTDGTNYTCVPVAFFNPSQKFICEGNTISYSDATMNLNGSPVTRLWDFPGGTPATDTSANPVIQYNTPGTYDVSLTVTNSAGTNTKTVTGMVVVSPAIGVMSSYPFSEGFETITVPGNDWYIINEAGTTWEQSGVAAHTGFTSMRIYNYTGNPSGSSDHLITTSFNLSNVTNTQMTFWRAFAYRSNSATDALKIYASSNCGQLWSLRYVKTGTALGTAGLVSSNFTPNSSQWLMDNVNLSTPLVSGKPNVRFKFEYTQDSGNNLYLDDINIIGTVGINEISAEQANFEVYPNPASAKAHISFSLSEKNNVQLKIYDAAGREIRTMVEKSLPAGEYQYEVESTIESGVYFVSLTIGENHTLKKLVLN